MKQIHYSFEAFEALLKSAVAKGCARLEVMGRTHDKEKDPIYALTVTDLTVPDRDKYHIVIAGLHVGGERAAMRAFRYAIQRLTSKAAEKYRRQYAVTFMPAVNPYGCFRTDIDQQHTTPDGMDPYTGDHGQCFDYPSLNLHAPENNPELAAFFKVIDEQKPELLMDWHGANGRYADDHMRESMGAALSNHLIMPWGTRLLAAMRREITKGGSAVFDMEEFLERIPAPNEIKDKVGPYFRPSWSFFYPDLYAYVKYHTMPIVMELGQPETGWRALKGAMDFGMNPPPEYLGAFPVDHLMIDFGSIVVHSGGNTPEDRRKSRVELQGKQASFQTFYLNPCYLGQLGAVVAIGPDGVQQFLGDTPITKVHETAAQNYPVNCQSKELNEFYAYPGRLQRWLPLAVNRQLADPLPETPLPKHGLTLQLFIPVGHRKQIRMTQVLCNGKCLKADSVCGYELVKGECGWYLFIHIPPKQSAKQALFCICARYENL